MTLHLPTVIQWQGDAKSGFLRLLDQTKLPDGVEYLECRDVQAVWGAIRRLSVRGAPLIGIAAAYGCVVGAQLGSVRAAGKYLATSRPTAVNLFWAIDRMLKLATDDPVKLLEEAKRIHQEDAAMCRAIGRHGLELIPPGAGVLTHCNAGALATGGIGTATAPMYLAAESGRSFRVYADETRPLLQGARLTCWELSRAGLDVTLLCDNMAATLMRDRRIDLIIVGADRIAANGDAANKIGTYTLAVLARHHQIPFYVAAPSSTFDLNCPDGASIPIEQRDRSEVTGVAGRFGSLPGVSVYNPAFDVTPASLIAGIVTEKGLIRPVDAAAIRRALGAG